jgi:hypothetical protein
MSTNIDETTVLEKFPHYTIHRDGRVYSHYVKRFLSSHVKDGKRYFYINLEEDGKKKRKTVAQHQLLAEAFIPNPEGLPVVRHIDGDGLNNEVENLEWSTRKDIMKKAYDEGEIMRASRSVAQYSKDGEYIRSFESVQEASKEAGCSSQYMSRICAEKKEYSGCMWLYEEEKDVPTKKELRQMKTLSDHPAYKISRDGKIYSALTNRYLCQTDRRDGYCRICIQGKKYYVHNLMAREFFGPPPHTLIVPVVNHKDGNKSNNTIENLEWIEFSGNISHAHENDLIPAKLPPVIRYDLEGKEIARYKNVATAAREVDKKHSSILAACHKKDRVNTIADSIWRFQTDPLKPGEIKDIKPGKRPIVQYGSDGKKISEYRSITDAFRSTGVDVGSIVRACQNKSTYPGGFQWRYREEAPDNLPKVKVSCEKPVHQFRTDGKFIRTWPSITEASQTLKINASHITAVCQGRKGRKSTGGYVWKYAEE